jgi:hypothetical protein
MKHYLLTFCAIICFVFPNNANTQPGLSKPNKRIIVDEYGIMRYAATNEEVKGFGVNYTVPFAHAFRSAKKMGIDPLKAIDQDVYHFSRLGFDLYRVHVWDTEISDTLGNLIFNEQLNAFDYLLKKLGERNINYVLTPIAFWGGGWPEPDLPTPGFSAKYGKGDCLTNPLAIKAQENYLTQFMNHINPYTGIAYKNDPRLIAVEISNEPHHRESGDKVTSFIERMVNAVRKSGYENPIFYNVSHSVHLAKDYFNADIQGGTFQWYPTGLGYQQELDGNFLPNVDRYKIPFDDVIRKNKGAKLVYEFDAADIGKSYIYPAMARSFRTAGIQIATHFSYDPTFLADVNTEYNTHHMNLAYTPQKALSLKICSEIFHQVPLYKSYGSYPENTTFEHFSVSYEKDLALFNHPEKFYHTNTTTVTPVDPIQLKSVAGFGSSPIVKYDGTGAYFIDKLEDGIWRLEVMPDAMIISNPYGRNSLDKKVAAVQWNERSMSVQLDDLGLEFKVTPLNGSNQFKPIVKGTSFQVNPGGYILAEKTKNTPMKASQPWRDGTLGEYFAPTSTLDGIVALHDPFQSTIETLPLQIEAKVISPSPVLKVEAYVHNGSQGKQMEMKQTHGFDYEVVIPANLVKAGFFSYYIVIQTTDETITFPSGKIGQPYNWNFYDRSPYQIQVNKTEHPINLFNAKDDWETLSFKSWPRGSQLMPSGEINELEYQIRNCVLYFPDNENLYGPVIKDFAVRLYLNKKIDHLKEQLKNKNELVLKGRSLDAGPKNIQIAFILKNGSAFGKVIEFSSQLKEHRISLKELKQVKMVTMPRPYPTFLPYYSEVDQAVFDVRNIEGIQINIGPGIDTSMLEQAHNIGISWISLE